MAEFKTDIEIAQEAQPKHIREIAAKLGIVEDDLEYYGKYKAKIDYNLLNQPRKSDKPAKLILCTAINPTPAGEGKTTTTVGVGDALSFSFILFGLYASSSVTLPVCGIYTISDLVTYNLTGKTIDEHLNDKWHLDYPK